MSSKRDRKKEGEDVRSYLMGEGAQPAPAVQGDSDVFGRKNKPLGKSIIVGLDKNKAKAKEEGKTTRSSGPSSGSGKTIVLPGSGRSANESLLIQGAQHAVERVVKSPDLVVHSLGISTRLHCFFVETEKFRGYVLVAYAQTKDLEKKFKDDLRKTFLQFMRASGIKMEIRDTADITILEVDFEEWSLKESEFLVKSVHAGAEVAVTFFPTDSAHQALETSPDGKMVSIPIEEIEVEVPLEFDLFVYLPTNRKYLHYTKKNGRMTQVQKDRLVASQTGHLHVRAEEKSQVNEWRTTKFLNEKIRQHRTRKAS